MKREELEKYILQTHRIIASIRNSQGPQQSSPGASAVCEAAAGYGAAQNTDSAEKLLRQLPFGSNTVEGYEQIPDERRVELIDPRIRKVIVYDLEGNEGPQIHDLKGNLGIGIYQGELTIDLDEIAQLF